MNEYNVAEAKVAKEQTTYTTITMLVTVRTMHIRYGISSSQQIVASVPHNDGA